MMSIVKLKNKKNGVTYVYESEGFWVKEKQQARNKRKCIGKLDPETGEIIYNQRYHEEHERAAEKKRGPEPSSRHTRLFCGATALFDHIVNALGIDVHLKKCFPETYEQLLSIAYYLILEEKSPMSRFERWARTHKHPYGKPIPSQRSSELFLSIDEDAKQRFFDLRSQLIGEKEYLFYDTTSVSSFSEQIPQVKYGKNKDHDPLAQINLALLFADQSRQPICYRKLAGNIPDVKTIQKLLRDLEVLHIPKVKLIMDRGFYSEENVNDLYRHHYKFLMATKISLKFVRAHLDPIRDEMVARQYYSSRHKLYVRTFKMDWDYTHTKSRSGQKVQEKRRMYLHLYYDEQRATDEKVRLNERLDIYEEELLSGKLNKKNEKAYQQYFEISQTPVRGKKVVANEAAIQKSLKNSGYFALINNGISDPFEAIDVYRSKDLIEKAYNDLKSRLSLRRTSVSSEEGLEGKLFVQFVALIIVSYIKKQMDEKGLFKKYTIQEVLDELDVIECFQQPGSREFLGEVTAKQNKLFEDLGVDSILS